MKVGLSTYDLEHQALKDQKLPWIFQSLYVKEMRNSHRRCPIKKAFLKFRKIHRKTLVSEPLA